MAAGDGLISMKPTSIAHAGTSASINADGGVDFTAVTSLSLNGVFTGDYDNYLILIYHYQNTSEDAYWYRLRASGTDDTTDANYTSQYLLANSTTVAGGRLTGSGIYDGLVARTSATARSGDTIHVYGPALAQPTAMRSISAAGQSGGYIQDVASTHNQSTSYDGITILPTSNNMTGTVHVFGYEE